MALYKRWTARERKVVFRQRLQNLNIYVKDNENDSEENVIIGKT